MVSASQQFLADYATPLRPDQLDRLAVQLALRVNPDGQFSIDDWATGGPNGSRHPNSNYPAPPTTSTTPERFLPESGDDPAP